MPTVAGKSPKRKQTEAVHMEKGPATNTLKTNTINNRN